VYRLSNEFAIHSYTRHCTVTVVGCGGTGGFVAEALCRLLPADAELVLVDHDRVEERNLTRQSFYREDMGQFKSEVLAHRLARRFERPVGYSTAPISMTGISLPGLVIGCVDNGLARGDIARAVLRVRDTIYAYGSWWVDAGNGENYGQVLIGNTNVAADMVPDGEIYRGLPLPTIQRPELLNQAPKARDCAAIAEEQGPTINLVMAAVVVEVVHRLIAGTCSWVQLYIDIEAGTLVPVLASPETVNSLKQRKGGSHGHRKRRAKVGNQAQG
jgi:hypothetical protein